MIRYLTVTMLSIGIAGCAGLNPHRPVVVATDDSPPVPVVDGGSTDEDSAREAGSVAVAVPANADSGEAGAAATSLAERLVLEVLREVNLARREANRAALLVDANLSRAAARYSRELALRGDLDHDSPTPGLRTFRQRLEAEGARARIAGENLARSPATASAMPGRVVRAWLRSPGHRDNMLDAIFSRTGLGVWQGRDGRWYVVQLFATPD